MLSTMLSSGLLGIVRSNVPIPDVSLAHGLAKAETPIGRPPRGSSAPIHNTRNQAHFRTKMPRKPLIMTFRLDEATRDRIRETVRYSPYRDPSAFIRAAIADLLAREEERPSGWTARR